MPEKNGNKRKKRKPNLGFARGGILGRGMTRTQGRAAKIAMSAATRRKKNKNKK